MRAMRTGELGLSSGGRGAAPEWGRKGGERRQAMRSIGLDRTDAHSPGGARGWWTESLASPGAGRSGMGWVEFGGAREIKGGVTETERDPEWKGANEVEEVATRGGELARWFWRSEQTADGLVSGTGTGVAVPVWIMPTGGSPLGEFKKAGGNGGGGCVRIFGPGHPRGPRGRANTTLSREDEPLEMTAWPYFFLWPLFLSPSFPSQRSHRRSLAAVGVNDKRRSEPEPPDMRV